MLYSEPKFYNHIAKIIHALHQSHFIEVAQGDIFMEQKRRFGLVCNTENQPTFDDIFSCFHGQKKFKIF